MVDAHLVGCNWVQMPAGKYKIRQNNDKNLPPKSRCQLEVDIAWEHVVSHPTVGEWMKVAPVRILSFNIQCARRKGRFLLDKLFYLIKNVRRQLVVYTQLNSTTCIHLLLFILQNKG